MALESVLGQALSRNKVRLKQDFLLETGDVCQGKFQVIKPAGYQMNWQERSNGKNYEMAILYRVQHVLQQTFARLMRKSISGKREKSRTCESVRIFSVESGRTVN